MSGTAFMLSSFAISLSPFSLLMPPIRHFFFCRFRHWWFSCWFDWFLLLSPYFRCRWLRWCHWCFSHFLSFACWLFMPPYRDAYMFIFADAADIADIYSLFFLYWYAADDFRFIFFHWWCRHISYFLSMLFFSFSCFATCHVFAMFTLILLFRLFSLLLIISLSDCRRRLFLCRWCFLSFHFRYFALSIFLLSAFSFAFFWCHAMSFLLDFRFRFRAITPAACLFYADDFSFSSLLPHSCHCHRHDWLFTLLRFDADIFADAFLRFLILLLLFWY